MSKKFPSYLQYDTVDCGPTCLQMICKYYGRQISIETLRERSFINREGISLHGITDAAESLGFDTIAIKISVDQIFTEVPLPCIAHVNQAHFVIIYKVEKGTIYTADPGIGRVKYTKDEFCKIWNANNDDEGMESQGILMLLAPSDELFESFKDDYAQDRTTGVKYLLTHFKKHRKILVQLFMGLLAASIIQFLFPLFTQLIVDVGINQKNVPFLYLILFGQMFLFLSSNVIDFVRRWLLLHLSTRINISIISDFLFKLMSLPLSYFDGKFMGDTLQRIEDHSRIERFLSTSTLTTFFSILTFLVFSVLLANYNLTIFGIFIFFSSVYLLFILKFLKYRKIIDYKRFSVQAENQTGIHQLLVGMQEIKLNNCEKRKRWEWEGIQGRLFTLNIDSTKLSQMQEAGALFINEFKNLLITFLSAKAVISGDITFGMMLSIQYIIGALNAPLSDFVHFITDFQNAKISLDRIGEIHTLKSEDDRSAMPAIPLQLDENDSTLYLNGISFYYEGPRSPKVLDNVNIEITAGKVTAIVGTSGSGKTTLLKLLLKFYDPYEGNITAGKIEIKNMASDIWRSKCGVVMQDGYIFNDTIEANVAISSDTIDYDRLQNAITIANAKEFIDLLPLGLKTKVGNSGVGLSMGQKQRLLIARAVYKNPKYIFFDEATSALDANNEKIISDNLNTFFTGRTAVVIAHRLSTVKNANQIIVMDRGRVVETGNHNILIKNKGFYYNLVKNQLELGS
jgi:ATP-binding cassette subfamily B protein